jgi:hypothetical protein
MKLKHPTRYTTLILIIAIITSSTFLTSLSKADWNITISDAVEYSLDDSTWSVNFDGNLITASGGYFNGLMINDPGTFSVEVLDIDEVWGVEFQVENATDYVYEYMTMDRFYFEFLKFLYYAIDESSRLAEIGFNESRIQKGPALLPWFFIEPTQETWNFLSNMSDINYHNNLPIVKDIQGNLRAEFEKVNTEASFDIVIQGSLENATENINLDFDHSLKFVWNATTGVLLGYRISSYFTGSNKGHSMSEEINVVCRQVNYDLDRFKFLSGFIPGFSFVITLVCLGLLGSCFLIINRKRKKKNK